MKTIQKRSNNAAPPLIENYPHQPHQSLTQTQMKQKHVTLISLIFLNEFLVNLPSSSNELQTPVLKRQRKRSGTEGKPSNGATSLSAKPSLKIKDNEANKKSHTAPATIDPKM